MRAVISMASPLQPRNTLSCTEYRSQDRFHSRRNVGSKPNHHMLRKSSGSIKLFRLKYQYLHNDCLIGCTRDSLSHKPI